MDRPTPSTHRVTTGAEGGPVLVKRATDEGGRARLRGEATVLRALSHPDVVRVVAVVDDDDAVELHLAWVGSHSLATVVGLGPRAAAEVVAAVAATVADVHAAGLVHRRLRRDHVVLGPGGRPVLTGFADAVGTGRADRSADVAALGILLTGLVAPGEEDMVLPERRRDRWIGRGRPGSSRRDRGLRGALLTLADQAQADDPETRPTAAELASSLRATVGLDPDRSVAPKASSAPAAASRPLLRPHRADPAPPLVPRRDPRIPRGGQRPLAGRRRRRLAALAFGVCTAATLVAGLTRARAEEGSRATAPPATAAAPSTSPLPSAAPLSLPASPPRPSAPPVPAQPPCPPVDPGSHDVDGDGCPDVVRVAGERVSVGRTTWSVGRPGDRAVVGDWDCDGTATVAVLRPSTGEVFVYDRWVGVGDELTVRPVRQVDEAAGIRGTDVDGDGCPELTVTAPGREVAVFPVGSP